MLVITLHETNGITRFDDVTDINLLMSKLDLTGVIRIEIEEK